MRHYRHPPVPLILGVILSRPLDDNRRRATISQREGTGALFAGVFTSPLSAVLVLSVILIFVSQTPLWVRAKARNLGGERSVE